MSKPIPEHQREILIRCLETQLSEMTVLIENLSAEFTDAEWDVLWQSQAKSTIEFTLSEHEQTTIMPMGSQTSRQFIINAIAKEYKEQRIREPLSLNLLRTRLEEAKRLIQQFHSAQIPQTPPDNQKTGRLILSATLFMGAFATALFDANSSPPDLKTVVPALSCLANSVTWWLSSQR